MEIKEIVLPSINKFASDYVKNLSRTSDFFHYDLKEAKVYEQRYQDLMEQSFNREELTLVIEEYMKKFGISKEVQRNIARLKQQDAAVVIGGQQAGLLTGPMYTIHKVISIIKLAEEQEKRLNRPVIPVFWIAGEDHDLDEVNHVFVERNGGFYKHAYRTSIETKAAVSDIPLEEEDIARWLDGVFANLEETRFTKELYMKLEHYCRTSDTMTDFFSFIINELFAGYGLLLIDSADHGFRKMQSAFFETLIRGQKEINLAVGKQQSFIKEQGYKPAIAMDENCANLFLYDNKERILLEFDEEDGLFKGKGHSVRLTEEELLAIAREHPEKLSNNVVTRPMMQERMFPVLAFISGPGEIAYWAELKQAFEYVNMKMPPIVPRMNLTILERKVEKALQEVDMDIYEALVQGTDKAKERFLLSVEDEQAAWLYDKMVKQFQQNHELFSHAALNVDKGLAALLKKNAETIEKQMKFINERVRKSTEDQHQLTLRKYAIIGNALRPNGGPQERLVNVYYYLNQYGPQFVQELIALPLEANPYHKIIVM
ncbi:MAG: bacillithiol biosynthesis cysteine-adding enzyme BshC [Bacillus sp. (in: firmicutes)]